jgi:lysophospholipase L1-like esterase
VRHVAAWRNALPARILLAVVSTLLFLAAAEGISRLYYLERWPYRYLFDEELLWKHRPHWRGLDRGDVQTEFNSLGLRESHELDSPPKVPRLLVIGDSIAYGYALERDETITTRMQALWPERHGGDEIEVVNAGVSGYATEQQTLWMERLAPLIEPTRVVLFFCIGNDIAPESLARYQARRSSLFNPGFNAMAMPPSRLQRMTETSALVYALTRFVSRQRRESPSVDPDFPGLRFSPFDRFVELSEAEKDAHYAALRERLAAFERLADAIGAPASIVLFPEQEQVEGSQSLESIRRVLEIALAVGLPTLDLLEAFRASQAPPIRVKDGTHPSPAGADVAAREIVDFLGQL